jgi:anti-sigma factor RsiW
MKCRDCAEFLAEYVAGELPPDELEVFERHLKACRNCEEYMHQYRLTIAAGKVACADMPQDIPEALVQAILAARPKRS